MNQLNFKIFIVIHYLYVMRNCLNSFFCPEATLYDSGMDMNAVDMDVAYLLKLRTTALNIFIF